MFTLALAGSKVFLNCLIDFWRQCCFHVTQRHTPCDRKVRVKDQLWHVSCYWVSVSIMLSLIMEIYAFQLARFEILSLSLTHSEATLLVRSFVFVACWNNSGNELETCGGAIHIKRDFYSKLVIKKRERLALAPCRRWERSENERFIYDANYAHHHNWKRSLKCYANDDDELYAQFAVPHCIILSERLPRRISNATAIKSYPWNSSH